MSTLFSGHYLRNCSTLVVGVLGYIGIVQHKEHSPEVLSIPPGTPCLFLHMYNTYYIYICMYIYIGSLQRYSLDCNLAAINLFEPEFYI